MSSSIVLTFLSDFNFSNKKNISLREITNKPTVVIISGNIFEDINYGGGNGRNYNTADASAQSSGWNAGDVGVNNVRVELYDASGNLIKVTNSDVNGNYAFTDLAVGNYFVRVVNKLVVSNRGSLAAGEAVLPVQTFRSDGTIDIINEVGGANPSVEDYGSNSIATLSLIHI